MLNWSKWIWYIRTDPAGWDLTRTPVNSVHVLLGEQSGSVAFDAYFAGIRTYLGALATSPDKRLVLNIATLSNQWEASHPSGQFDPDRICPAPTLRQRLAGLAVRL